MFLNVIATACIPLVVLTWLGWRYFLAPVNRERIKQDADTATVAPSISPQTSVPNASAAYAVARAVFMTHRSLWFAVLTLGAAAAAVLALSDRVSLDPLGSKEIVSQKRIEEAFRPAVLVPPPSLPPTVFQGVERPGLETANRDWSRLDPNFMRTALQLFAKMEARGFPLALLEGYRSPDRQDVLADSHTHVTNVRAFQSKHQYGLALDAAPIRDGRIVISEKDPWAMQAYTALGEEAEKLGLVWGGRWRLRDYGHVEAAGGISVAAKNK